MQTEILYKRIRAMEISEKIEKALKEHYFELGRPVPLWKKENSPDWWRNYLIELGMDPNNP